MKGEGHAVVTGKQLQFSHREDKSSCLRKGSLRGRSQSAVGEAELLCVPVLGNRSCPALRAQSS